ncbi:DUF2306 domain-containing protein [Jiulongibacter sediminis]|jgi:uncharacterized membrane protein|uniref:DUF2306 domain-containing protein n=1 Tax=Jiulongibacter sediminis TaxID=1605367 RepID=UPI0026EB7312|nr:DUF2306 domain-containing protein [Jiulongibacter sediminis]
MKKNRAAKVYLVTQNILKAAVWISSGLFGLYILGYYFKALLQGHTAQWNEILPGLYDQNTRQATDGIGLHFAAGGLILVLGSIQFIHKIRLKWPQVHRWIGRIYVLACVLAAIGGLVFIFQKGTIGGWIMDIGIAGYGILMLIAGVETFRNAYSGNFELHRAWAIRLYALAIGSWLYRMDYGFWHAATDLAGHGDNFSGPFDYFMDFFFYLPNLVVAELIIQRKTLSKSPFLSGVASVLFIGIIVFIVLATKVFWDHYWGEPIINFFK